MSLRYRCVRMRVWFGTHLCKQIAEASTTAYTRTHTDSCLGATENIWSIFLRTPLRVCLCAFVPKKRHEATKEHIKGKQNKSNNNADRWQKKQNDQINLHTYVRKKRGTKKAEQKKSTRRRSGTCRIDWHSNIEFVCDFAWEHCSAVRRFVLCASTISSFFSFGFTIHLFPSFACAFLRKHAVNWARLLLPVVVTAHHQVWNVIFFAFSSQYFCFDARNDAEWNDRESKNGIDNGTNAHFFLLQVLFESNMDYETRIMPGSIRFRWMCRFLILLQTINCLLSVDTLIAFFFV